MTTIYGVELLPLTNKGFDNNGPKNGNDSCGDNEATPKQPLTYVVVEDIPAFAKEHDMFKMFPDYSHLGSDIRSKNRGRNAYIQFN